MPTTCVTTQGQQAAEACKPTSATPTQKSTDWETQKREYYCSIPPNTGIAVARFNADNQIVMFACAAWHSRFQGVDRLFFLDSAELGRAEAAKKAADAGDVEARAAAVPNLLVSLFKGDRSMQPGDEKIFRPLQGGRLTPVLLSDHNKGGKTRMTLMAEFASPGGYWASIKMEKESLYGRGSVTAEKLIPSSWQTPRQQFLVPLKNNTGPEALPLAEEAYDYAVNYPTAWSAVRHILQLVNYNANMQEDGRMVAGSEHLRKPQSTRQRNNGFRMGGIPAATLDSFKSTPKLESAVKAAETNKS